MSSTSKYIQYNFKLSSRSISFSEPGNYSKNFPQPQKTSLSLDIFDPDTYTDSKHTRVLHQSYWDFGKTFIFSKVKGTLYITVVLFRSYQNDLDLEKEDQFSKAIQLDFNKNNPKQDIKDYGITPPEEFKLITINRIQWVHYVYDVGGEKKFIYTIPLSEHHYLKVNLNFIDNSPGEKNNWKEHATSTMNQIMSSFKIN